MSKRWRRLTDNEIKMAKLIFADSIDYARVKIYQGIPCLPTMQVAVSPNGNIYFPRNNCPDDFVLASESHQIWMIHELTHVWQYQQGFKTWLGGLFLFVSGGYAEYGAAGGFIGALLRVVLSKRQHIQRPKSNLSKDFKVVYRRPVPKRMAASMQVLSKKQTDLKAFAV